MGIPSRLGKNSNLFLERQYKHTVHAGVHCLSIMDDMRNSEHASRNYLNRIQLRLKKGFKIFCDRCKHEWMNSH